MNCLELYCKHYLLIAGWKNEKKTIIENFFWQQ